MTTAATIRCRRRREPIVEVMIVVVACCRWRASLNRKTPAGGVWPGQSSVNRPTRNSNVQGWPPVPSLTAQRKAPARVAELAGAKFCHVNMLYSVRMLSGSQRTSAGPPRLVAVYALLRSGIPQHAGSDDWSPCSTRSEAPSVLRIRADCGGRLFTAKLAVVAHDMAHQLLN